MKTLDSATILAGATAFLYSSSTAYIHGYFNILSLDSDVLDRNFHQILYHGMTLNIFPLFFLPFILAVVVTLHSGFSLSVIDFYNTGYKNKKKVVKLHRLLSLRKEKSSAQIMYSKRIKKSWVIFGFIFTFMFSMAIFDRNGRINAKSVLSSIEDGTYNSVEVKSSGDKFVFLYCGARNCAGVDTETGLIRYFQQTGHAFMSYKNTKQKTKK